jgi:hypothetical protein
VRIDNPVTRGLVDIIGKKSQSDSASHRVGAALFSMNLAVKTWGLGVGLGANRPSSFVTMLLSSVGIVGFVLFLIGVSRLIVDAHPLPQATPIVWGLCGLLLGKTVAEPALSTPLLWVFVGVLGAVSQAGPVGSSDRFPEMGRIREHTQPKSHHGLQRPGHHDGEAGPADRDVTTPIADGPLRA